MAELGSGIESDTEDLPWVDAREAGRTVVGPDGDRVGEVSGRTGPRADDRHATGRETVGGIW